MQRQNPLSNPISTSNSFVLYSDNRVCPQDNRTNHGPCSFERTLIVPDIMSKPEAPDKLTTPVIRPSERAHVVDPQEGPVAPFPMCLSGAVVKGFGRGSKELGIPTANLEESAIPDLLGHAESGIYYGLACIEGDDTTYEMVMSVGWNPYYKNTVRSVEVHIMHKFHEDFYGKQLRIIVIGFIRPEYNYTSMESLIEDINEDMNVARRSLARPAYQKYRSDEFLKAHTGSSL